MINRILIAVALLAVAVAKGYAYIPVMLHSDGASFGTRAISASQGQQVGYMQNEIGAFLWAGSAASMIDLSPPGYLRSTVSAVYNGRQVGGAYHPGLDQGHALMWNSSPNDFVSLHVTSLGGHTILDTFAYGIGGEQQVGGGANPQGGLRAILWGGTASSAVLLHPQSGWVHTQALATDGVQQVGWGSDMNIISRPLLWTGSAESLVDLTPAGAGQGYATGVANGHQVGYVDIGGVPKAIMWEGSAHDYINLTPPGHSAGAFGTNGVQQVGNYSGPTTGGFQNAVVWSGSPDNYHNLHQYVAGWGITHSNALGIDEVGNVVGRVFIPGVGERAVMWVVPEPSSVAALAAGIGLLVLRRRRKCASG